MARKQSKPNDAQVLQGIIDALNSVEEDTRVRLLETAARFFDISLGRRISAPRFQTPATELVQNRLDYDGVESENNTDSISPKDFILDKQPQTDLERVACLAYYLIHFRDTPQFKTIDISKLNTEAAQSKFSNTAYAVNNSTKSGYLIQAGKGQKKLSAYGEKFVQALPDRESAKDVIAKMKPKRRKKRQAKKTNSKGK